MGHHLLYGAMGEELELGQIVGHGLGEEESELIYGRRISTGWWLQPILVVAI